MTLFVSGPATLMVLHNSTAVHGNRPSNIYLGLNLVMLCAYGSCHLLLWRIYGCTVCSCVSTSSATINGHSRAKALE